MSDSGIEEFVNEMNRQLDELDSRLATIYEEITRNTPLGETGNTTSLQSSTSVSSNGSLDGAVSSIQWDDLVDTFSISPEAAMLSLIGYSRNTLGKKSSAKKLIEKANSQYVDTSFQRVSTQLTALINQALLQNHADFETEILDVSNKLDSLKEHMTHEFAEIKNMIQEIRHQKLEMERSQAYPQFMQRQQMINTASYPNQRFQMNAALRRSAPLSKSRTKRKSGQQKPVDLEIDYHHLL